MDVVQKDACKTECLDEHVICKTKVVGCKGDCMCTCQAVVDTCQRMCDIKYHYCSEHKVRWDPNITSMHARLALPLHSAAFLQPPRESESDLRARERERERERDRDRERERERLIS